MERFSLTIFILYFFIPTYGQAKLTKNRKTISIDARKILNIETRLDFISVFGHDYRNDKANNPKPKYRVDFFKNIDVKGDSVIVLAEKTVQYLDSITGKIYTNKEMENEERKGNMFFSVYPVVKDTTFYFDKADIIKIRLRIKEETYGGGIGLAGLLLIGTVATIGGTVDAIKGDDSGFILIGVGVLMFGAVKYMVDRSKWFVDYQIEKKKWAIGTENKTAYNIKPSRRKAPQKSPTQRVEL